MLPDIQEYEVGTFDQDSLPAAVKDLRRMTHNTIQKVTEDLDGRFHFNTAISAVMELVNAAYAFELPRTASKDRTCAVCALRETIEVTIMLLSPFVSHIAEELWETLGYASSIFNEPWLQYDQNAAKAEEILIVVAGPMVSSQPYNSYSRRL